MNGKIIGEAPIWYKMNAWTDSNTISFTLPKFPKFVLIGLRLRGSTAGEENVYSGWSDSFYKTVLMLGNYALTLDSRTAETGMTLIFTASVHNFGLFINALVV